MSSTNIAEQTDLAKTQIDNLYYPGAYDEWEANDPDRLAAELNALLQDVTPQGAHKFNTTDQPEPQDTNEKPTIKEKREALKAMSKFVKPLVGEDEKYQSVNEAIIDTFYKPEGHTELHTFDQWIKLGFAVRKGQRALLVWGSPVAKKKEGEAKAKEAAPSEEEKDFWPLCFLFSQKQVAPIKDKENE